MSKSYCLELRDFKVKGSRGIVCYYRISDLIEKNDESNENNREDSDQNKR